MGLWLANQVARGQLTQLWAYDTSEADLGPEARSPGFSVNLDPAPQTSACLSIPLSPVDRVTWANGHRFLWKRTEEVMTMYPLPTVAGSFFVGTWLLPQARDSGVKTWPMPGSWAMDWGPDWDSVFSHPHPSLTYFDCKDWAIPFGAAIYLTPKGSVLKEKNISLPETLRIWIILIRVQ